jgi:hypothetical protein
MVVAGRRAGLSAARQPRCQTGDVDAVLEALR